MDLKAYLKNMNAIQAKELYKWMIHFRNPKEILHDNPSYLALEVVLYVCFILSFRHAWRHGGRHMSLFIATVLNGIAIESLSFFHPDVNNFWHGQSSVMLLGRRLPLHIVCFYPAIFYTAIVSISKMKLPRCSPFFAVGIASTVLTFPMDILGAKLLWWTFHDTDPNLQDRVRWAPWVTFCFPAALASSLSFVLYFLRKIIVGKSSKESGSKCLHCCKEFVCLTLAAVLTIPVIALQFNLLYHVPHDVFRIPTHICVSFYLALFALVSWMKGKNRQERENVKGKMDELFVLVIVHFTFLVATVLSVKPENIFSVGLHQPIGNCSETETIHTSMGMAMERNKYLCASNYHFGYFDFHCAMQPTTKWSDEKDYTICGTPFPNHMEYIAIIASSAVFGIYFYYKLFKNAKMTSVSKKKVK